MEINWSARAACLGLDIDMFFPDSQVGGGGEFQYRDARLVCSKCPVRSECLESSFIEEAPSERFGMRGGLSAKQRNKLWVKRRDEKKALKKETTESELFHGKPSEHNE